MTVKVFVSHASKDKDRFVLGFAEKLRENGIDAWLDKWEMLPGDSLVDKIFEEGVKEAKAFIIVLSEHSVTKPWVREELNAAFVKRVEQNTKLIPVVIGECEIPECLKTTLYCKINPESDYDEELKSILLSITGQNEKPKLGTAPKYLSRKGFELPDLSEIDNKVLFSLCEVGIDERGFRVDQSKLRDIEKDFDLSPEDFNDCLDILDRKGFIKGHKAIGTAIFLVELKFPTIDIFLKNTRDDYEDLFTKVGLSILNNGNRRNVQISDNLNIPFNIVNFVLDAFERKGLIRTIGMLGGARDIADVSPEFKRMFQ